MIMLYPGNLEVAFEEVVATGTGVGQTGCNRQVSKCVPDIRTLLFADVPQKSPSSS